MTDDEGNILWQNDFTPFGEETGESGFVERDGFYTGKKIDRDTGLYYFGARWYDPELGRFITSDPIKDGVNWYSYVSNRPLTMIDPTGLYGMTADDYNSMKDDLKDSYKEDRKERRKKDDRQERKERAAQYYEDAKAKAVRDNNRFNRDNPFNQIENLDDEYLDYCGLTVSCQTASIVNIHAANSENGITQRQLDQVAMLDNTGVNDNGSLHSISTLSQNIARATNSEVAYSPIWRKKSEGGGFLKQSPSEFAKSDFQNGIGKFTRTDADGNTYQHFQAIVKEPGRALGQSNIDSLDSQRDVASLYRLTEVYPLKTVAVNYNN